jgi:cytochrome c553
LSAGCLHRGAALAALFFCLCTTARAASIEERVAVCWSCHGENGQSVQKEVPSLGGQPEFFLLTQLFLFREGRRGGPMIELARGFSDDDLRAFSARLAKLPPPQPPPGKPEPARIERAQALLKKVHCPVCHNPDFSGRQQMPRLASQREDYLLKSMREFKSGRRIGYGAAMTQELDGLSDQDLQDLAYFLARVPPGGGAAR